MVGPRVGARGAWQHCVQKQWWSILRTQRSQVLQWWHRSGLMLRHVAQYRGRPCTSRMMSDVSGQSRVCRYAGSASAGSWSSSAFSSRLILNCDGGPGTRAAHGTELASARAHVPTGEGATPPELARTRPGGAPGAVKTAHASDVATSSHSAWKTTPSTTTRPQRVARGRPSAPPQPYANA